MNKLKKRILALGLSIAMALSLVPMFSGVAFAAEANTATVYVTISTRGELAKAKDGSPMAWKEVTVTDLDKDGAFSYDEALVAAHATYYTSDAYATSQTQWGTSVTKLWGEETPNTLHFLNDVPLPNGVGTDKVEEGDYLLSAIIVDSTSYTDFYATFGTNGLTVEQGKDITVNLSGYMGMTWETPTYEAIAKAKLGYFTQDGTYNDLNQTTDAEGNAIITFDEPGTYYLTASGSVAGTVVTDYSLENLGGDPAIYGFKGTEDEDYEDSTISYTDKDYVEGPYPAEEVKTMNFWDWKDLKDDDPEAYAKIYPLHSNQLIKTAAIMAPAAIITVEGETIELTVDNKYRMFQPSAAALIISAEGKFIELTYTSTNYDKAYVGTAKEAVIIGDSSKLAERSTEGKYLIPVTALDGEFNVAFHSVNNEGWYDRIFEINLNEEKLTTDTTGGAIVPDDYGNDWDEENAVESSLGMFQIESSKITVEDDGTATVKIMAGNPNRAFPKIALIEQTATEAEKEAAAIIGVSTGDANNNYVYEFSIPVEQLGAAIPISHYQTRKGESEWHDWSEQHTITINSADVVNQLIGQIQIQRNNEFTEKYIEAAKRCWDNLPEDKQEEDDGYFSDDTGDASKDDSRNQNNIGEKEILVVSFGTSFNDSRVATIKAVEDALAEAFPEYSVRRAFTAQIIINHVQARDGEVIDNMKQALDRAVANNVKELVVQPTHLMHGAEYDEMCEELEAYEDKFDKIIISEPLLNTDEDKTIVAKGIVDEAVADSEYDSLDAAAAAKTAFVFMGHGTEHSANVTYEQMQAIFNGLNYNNVFVGTVEGLPESTEVNTVLAKVQAAGYEKVILRPLMVVAGDHANNDMADTEDEESWASIFGAALGAENVDCQINGLGEIEAVQQVYVAHVKDALDKDAIAIEDGVYRLPELEAGPSAMFNHFVADSKFLIVNGDTATIRFITDASTASIQKYSRIALGKSSEMLTENYQPDSALPEGTVIIDGILQPKISGDKYLFEITIAKEEAEKLLANDKEDDIYITVWNKEGSSSQKVPGWYLPSNDIYLSLGTLGEEAEIPAPVELAITNGTSMFKAVSASLAEEGGQCYLVMALSGTGYHELFKGTYDDAVANGDNTDNWIHGYQNAEGKWEFVIPVEEGESYMPIVAVSDSYYQKYLKGQNPLARAFYPRQATLDVEAKTLVTDDYNETVDLAVTNNVKMFSLASAKMTTEGGPNSNGYKVEGIVTMGSTSFSKVFIGFADDAAAAAEKDIITLGDDLTWTIDLEHIVTPGNPDTTVSILDTPVYVSFFSVENQDWYERVFTFSKKDKCVLVDPSAVDAINALPPAEELTLEDKEAVETAQRAYDALPEDEKDRVDESSLKDLKLAVTTIEKLEAEATVEEQNALLEKLQKELEELKEQLAKTPGWHTDEDGSKYYCDSQGEKVKGWLSDGGKWYYMDKESGVMQTGWVKDGSWYFMKEDGVMATGWVKDDGKWYYMNSSGAMLTGWVKDGNTWYYLLSSGEMAANEWREGYWLNANGSWTYQPKGSWKPDSKGWWFGDTSGWYAKSTTQKIDGVNYTFDAAGYWVK